MARKLTDRINRLEMAAGSGAVMIITRYIVGMDGRRGKDFVRTTIALGQPNKLEHFINAGHEVPKNG